MTITFTLPPHQTALTVDEHDKVTIWDVAPCPSLPPDQVCVRVEAVALNPSDTKMRGQFATPYAFLGTDYAGTVVAVGSQVTHIQVGDRVYGAQNEMCPRTPDQGAFSQYTVTRGRIWATVPEGWSFEQAASLPAGISTAGLAMKLLGLPLPDPNATTAPALPKPVYVLVYGGSTATATIVMQMLRLYCCLPLPASPSLIYVVLTGGIGSISCRSGYIPIATCSPHNFDLAKKHGAEDVFDYRDAGLAQTIVSSSPLPTKLSHAVDDC